MHEAGRRPDGKRPFLWSARGLPPLPVSENTSHPNKSSRPVKREQAPRTPERGCGPSCIRAAPRRAFRISAFLFLIFNLLFLTPFLYHYWREHRYDKVILAAARRYQVDPGLVKAIVWRESNFDSRAQGRAGELGLMQIRAPAAQEWAKSEHLATFRHTDCLDPATNTLAGTWYLKKLLKRYPQTDDPIPYALADYNAGRGNLLKWDHGAAQTNSAAFLDQIEFPTTRAYIQAITKRAPAYRRAMDN